MNAMNNIFDNYDHSPEANVNDVIVVMDGVVDLCEVDEDFASASLDCSKCDQTGILRCHRIVEVNDDTLIVETMNNWQKRLYKWVKVSGDWTWEA